jgi:pimeloyl-ACP methyl ester carboxylesterase
MIGAQTRVRFNDGAETVLEQWGDRGPVMLCVHGMTSSRKGWRRLAQAFQDRFRVFAYDQRGHGDAAAFAGPMNLERGSRDLAQVAAAIGEPVDVLVGHSWGGAIAILGGAAIDAHRVVAIDPMLDQIADAWYEEYIVELNGIFALTGSERDARVRAEYPGDPLDAEGKVHALHAMTVEPIANLLRENPAAEWPVVDALLHFDRPLLLAMADPSETCVTPATMERVRAQLPVPAEIETFTGEGHSLHRSAFARFAAVVERFLAVS